MVHSFALLDGMRAIQRDWTLQSRRDHQRRIVQTVAFVVFTRPLLYTAVARVSRAMGRDFDRFVNSAAHSFPAGSTEELVGRLEQRPSAPLLRFLRHRLGTFDHARLQARSASGKRLAALLPSGLHV